MVRDSDTKEKNSKEENIMGENFYRAIEEHLDDILFDREELFMRDKHTIVEQIADRLIEHLVEITNDEIKTYEKVIKEGI